MRVYAIEVNSAYFFLIGTFYGLCSMESIFQDMVKVLSEDNFAFEIPLYLRKNLELDLQARPEKTPQGLLMQVIFLIFFSFFSICNIY